VKAGGADGYEGTIYEDGSRSGAYCQASTETDVEGKIRRTVHRLLEFGRDPKVLTYIPSRTVSTAIASSDGCRTS